jgi:hypothetical protein
MTTEFKLEFKHPVQLDTLIWVIQKRSLGEGKTVLSQLAMWMDLFIDGCIDLVTVRYGDGIVSPCIFDDVKAPLHIFDNGMIQTILAAIYEHLKALNEGTKLPLNEGMYEHLKVLSESTKLPLNKGIWNVTTLEPKWKPKIEPIIQLDLIEVIEYDCRHSLIRLYYHIFQLCNDIRHFIQNCALADENGDALEKCLSDIQKGHIRQLLNDIYEALSCLDIYLTFYQLMADADATAINFQKLYQKSTLLNKTRINKVDFW